MQNTRRTILQDSDVIAVEFYIYDIDFAALVSGTSVTSSLRFEADADFRLQ